MSFLLALSDEQLDVLKAAAAPVPYSLRTHFLERIAARLGGRTIGNGELLQPARAANDLAQFARSRCVATSSFR
jgi:hypothetical protein